MANKEISPLDQQITELATQGLCPYAIEEKLGMPYYTIRIEHHKALMAGYSERETRLSTKAPKKTGRRKKYATPEEAKEARARRKRERYRNDPEFRRRTMERNMRYQNKRYAEDPEYRHMRSGYSRNSYRRRKEADNGKEQETH